MKWELQNQRQGVQAWCNVPGMFTPPELDAIETLAAEIPAQAAVVGGKGVRDLMTEGEIKTEVRDSDVRWIEPHASREWLFQRIDEIVTQVNAQHFGLDLASFAAMQFTEYRGAVGGHYGAHIDSGYGESAGRHRKLSLSLQLSDPTAYEGGVLALYPEGLKPVEIEKARGLITMFRSHVIHEVTPVSSGCRRSLVVWIEGPPLR